VSQAQVVVEKFCDGGNFLRKSCSG